MIEAFSKYIGFVRNFNRLNIRTQIKQLAAMLESVVERVPF